MTTRAEATTPNPTGYVGTCMACTDWQVDMPPRARRDFTSNEEAIRALVEAHSAHLPDCPGGTTGRVKSDGRWVDRPKMSDGKDVSGAAQMSPLPRWWTWWSADPPAAPAPAATTTPCTDKETR